MAKHAREGSDQSSESRSKGEPRQSEADQKAHPELHIDADAAHHHGLLTVACAQVGQVMLVMPHSMALMGVRNGIVIAGIAALGGLWTMFLLAALYVEMKARSIRNGTWYDASGKRRRATQYHEVMGYWGGPFLKYVAQTLVAVHLVGTCTAQIIACSGNNYSIMPQQNKRFYALVWGAVLVSASLLPTFRHFRLLNIFALLGTTYTGKGLPRVSCQ
ncbi:g3807 [Coccomyxa viridis]|uniref:G3807 protein n=1 Tax=Coccomyxa viridis TaxID=1274662 RepID=A0ABP1FNQ8_9CHLO